MDEPSSRSGRTLRFRTSQEAYLPILLDMRGELEALAALDEQSWTATLPHIQVRPLDLRHNKGAGTSPDEIIDLIARAVRSHPVYLDLVGLRRASGAPTVSQDFVEACLASAEGILSFRPVYLPGQGALLDVILPYARRHGLLVRIQLDRMQEFNLSVGSPLHTELGNLRREVADLEVLLDIGFIGPGATVSATFVSKAIRALEATGLFSSLTVAATSVPTTISKYVRELTIHGLRRQELNLYRELVKGMPILRFGDYGVQNCLAPDQHAPNMVASARFTMRDYTFYSRGKGALLKLPRAEKISQYQEIAKRVFEHDWFEGKDRCCIADAIIEECADGDLEIVNQNRWRYVGTRHHIPVALADVAALRRPAAVEATRARTRVRTPAGVAPDAPVAPIP